MRLRRAFDGYDIHLLFGERPIRAERGVIDAHRNRCDPAGGTVTSLDWFLSKRPVWGEIPAVALIRRERALLGVVLLYYFTKFGVPYGLVRGGHRGDAAVIAPPAEQRGLAETVAQFLVEHALAHTVVLTLPSAGPVAGDSGWTGRHMSARWSTREYRQCLSLAGGLDATMQRLSYKLRRNVRYYRRRAMADAQVRFIPKLTPAERRDAVAALADKGRYAIPLSQARSWDRALQPVPGAFAMGLQNAGGEWLSCIVGWRERSTTYVDLQLNDELESTSTVMRSYLLEHETARGSQAIVFVGGTSPIWRRACDPALASDLVVTGTRPMARLMRRAYLRLKPDTEVSYLCSGRDALGNPPCPVTLPQAAGELGTVALLPECTATSWRR